MLPTRGSSGGGRGRGREGGRERGRKGREGGREGGRRFSVKTFKHSYLASNVNDCIWVWQCIGT